MKKSACLIMAIAILLGVTTHDSIAASEGYSYTHESYTNDDDTRGSDQFFDDVLHFLRPFAITGPIGIAAAVIYYFIYQQVKKRKAMDS